MADDTRVHVTVLLTSYQRLLPHLSRGSMMVQLKGTFHEAILIISYAEVINSLFVAFPPVLLSLQGELSSLNYS